MVLISFSYAELEPGKLWINDVEIPYEKEIIIGDVSEDKQVTTYDASLVAQYFEELIDLTDNGTDSILFLSDSKFEPFEIKETDKNESLLYNIFI